jgi:SEC-C motif-containing protein
MPYIPCPCGSSLSYEKCCEPVHNDQLNAHTAEQLMRSRYSAFVFENADYLLQSWHPETRPESLDFDSESKWLGLKVKETKAGQESDDQGQVSFIARYKIAGKAHRIIELSQFLKVDGKWYYHSAIES